MRHSGPPKSQQRRKGASEAGRGGRVGPTSHCEMVEDASSFLVKPSTSARDIRWFVPFQDTRIIRPLSRGIRAVCTHYRAHDAREEVNWRDGLGAGKARLSRLYLLSGVQGHLGEDPPLEMVNPPSLVG